MDFYIKDDLHKMVSLDIFTIFLGKYWRNIKLFELAKIRNINSPKWGLQIVHRGKIERRMGKRTRRNKSSKRKEIGRLGESKKKEGSQIR